MDKVIEYRKKQIEIQNDIINELEDLDTPKIPKSKKKLNENYAIPVFNIKRKMITTDDDVGSLNGSKIEYSDSESFIDTK